jgi:hypothetical protein
MEWRSCVMWEEEVAFIQSSIPKKVWHGSTDTQLGLKEPDPIQ